MRYPGKFSRGPQNCLEISMQRTCNTRATHVQHTCNTTCNTTTFPVNLQSKWLSGHFRRPKATSKGKGANFTPSRENHRNLQQKCSCCTLCCTCVARVLHVCCTCVARWLHVLNCRVGGPYHPPLWSSPKRQKGKDGCKWSHSVYQPSQLHLHENCKKKLHRVLQKKQPSSISTQWFPTSPPYPQLQRCNPNLVLQAFKKKQPFLLALRTLTASTLMSGGVGDLWHNLWHCVGWLFFLKNPDSIATVCDSIATVCGMSFGT